jgi:hypothetical protein
VTSDDRELFDHYVSVGAEAWNGSIEAAWLDFELRAWVLPRLPRRRPIVACNVGIGCGLFDDWLGRALGRGTILVSVDRDPACCRLLAHRQAREDHPHPADVICGDVLDGVLANRRFDAITCVGSTLAENGAQAGALEDALVAALAPDGVLLLAESQPRGAFAPIDAELRGFADVELALRVVTR